MINERDYVELGLCCADICRALDRGMDGRRVDDLSQSVCEAINQLTMWVNPAIPGLSSSLTTFSIAGLLRRSKGGSSNRAGGMQSLDSSTQGTTRKRSPPGS